MIEYREGETADEARERLCPWRKAVYGEPWGSNEELAGRSGYEIAWRERGEWEASKAKGEDE